MQNHVNHVNHANNAHKEADTMQLELSIEEARFLKQQLKRHLAEMENELVHTEKHQLQHALALDLELMRTIETRLEELIAQGDSTS